WIEGDDRVRRPLERDDKGIQNPVSWHEATTKVSERLGAAGTADARSVRFLVSAHASHEELFLLRRLVEELISPAVMQAISVGWRFAPKSQPPDTTFKVPAVDAPNVTGARLLGLLPAADAADPVPADLSG